MTYDNWKTTEPDREPAPGEHQPGNDECPCDECERDRDRVMEPYELANARILEERNAARSDDRVSRARDLRGVPALDGDPRETIAPWFLKALESCETLSLDSARDRMILWERISEAWPRDAIRAMIYDNIRGPLHPPPTERDVESVTAAVIAALEES